MKRRFFVLVATVICLLALTSGSALALGTLDQHQTNTSGGNAHWIGGTKVAQMFTAGLTGKLDAVDINADASAANVSVQIMTGAGGEPDSVLATVIQTLNDAGWTQVHFTTPANVVKGTQYAIVLIPVSNLTWRGDCSNAYAGGAALVLDVHAWKYIPGWAADHGANTSFYCQQDWAFRTYVTPPPPPPPPPTKAPTPATTKAPTPTPTATESATPTPTATESATPTPISATPMGPPTESPAAAPTAAAGGTTGPAGGGDTTPLVALALVGGIIIGVLVAILALLLTRRQTPPSSTTPPRAEPNETPPTG